MKKLFSLLIVLVISLSFSACKKEQKEVKVENIEVKLELNEEKSTGNRICFNTNLPEKMLFSVEVYKGDEYHSIEDAQVQLDPQINYIVTEAQLDANEKPYPDGNYIVNITSLPMKEQPQTVKDRIGENGERMKGMFVLDGEDDTKIISLKQTVTKKGDKFSAE